MPSSISSTTKPAPVQPTLRTVLRPKWQATFARLREQKSEGTGKVVLLVLLWALGVATSYTLGGLLHLLLVVAVAVVLIRIIQGRRPVV